MGDGPQKNRPKGLPDIPKERYDLQILRSIRRIIRAVDLYSRRLKSKYQLTAPQLICLAAVSEQGSLTASEVAKQVYLSPSTTVGILDRLEKKEMIRRTRDDNDRRVVNVSITALGKRIIDQNPTLLQDNLAGALKDLPDLEQATIALSLKRVVDLMEAEHLAAAPIIETDLNSIDIEHNDDEGGG